LKLSIGKYIPRDSILHQLDPRAKLIGTLVSITSIMFVKELRDYIVPVTFFIVFMLLSKIHPIIYLRSLKSMWFLIAFASIVQYFVSGLVGSLYIALRLSLIFLFASMLTYTTPPLLTASGIVDLLKYFRISKETREDFGMMISISIRFIPVLLDETDRIIKAQTARGAKYTEKGFKNRLTAISSIIIPLLVSSLRKAEELSLALRARKYGMNPRTHYYELNWAFADTVYISASFVLFLLTLYVG